MECIIFRFGFQNVFGTIKKRINFKNQSALIQIYCDILFID